MKSCLFFFPTISYSNSLVQDNSRAGEEPRFFRLYITLHIM